MAAPFVLNFMSSIPSSPPISQPQQTKPAQAQDSLSFALPPDTNGTTLKGQIDVENRGLGTWFFDKRTRKRRYVSLIGKNFVGPAAIEQAKQDKISELHPANSARAELRYLMTTMAPNSLDDLLSAGPGSQNSSSTLFNNDPLALSQWGIPLRVVNKYISMGVKKLFPWQIECLGIDDGNVLRGGNYFLN